MDRNFLNHVADMLEQAAECFDNADYTIADTEENRKLVEDLNACNSDDPEEQYIKEWQGMIVIPDWALASYFAFKIRPKAEGPKKSAEAWCQELGIWLHDNEGWPDGTWDQRITREEFDTRVAASRIAYRKSDML